MLSTGNDDDDDDDDREQEKRSALGPGNRIYQLKERKNGYGIRILFSLLVLVPLARKGNRTEQNISLQNDPVTKGPLSTAPHSSFVTGLECERATNAK